MFNSIPISITPETIDMVTSKFLEMQRDGFDPVGMDFNNLLVQAQVYAFLETAADFPNDNNELLAFAAMVLGVVDSTVGPK